jgi:hypothetical protein
VIPFDYITEWRAEAPWIDDVEQDMVISRSPARRSNRTSL